MYSGNKLILFLFVLSLTASCRTNRNIPGKDIRTETDYTREYTGTDDQRKYSQSLRLRKAEVNFSLNGKEENTSASIGIIRDSIIVISVVPVAGIEVMRIYCTRDSLTVINRQDKTYSQSAISRIQEKYNLAIDYMVIQSVLSNELFLYGKDESTEYKVKETTDDDQNRLVEYKIWGAGEEDILQQVYFNREKELLNKVAITDFKRKVMLNIDYQDFIEMEGTFFPRNITARIDDPGNKINMQIKAERIQFNDEVRIREIIPDGYKRIQF